MSEHQLPWGKLLIVLSRELTQAHLEEAWVYCRKHLPQSETEAKSSWLNLFTALEDAGVIDVDNTAYLKEMLENIGAKHCTEDVESYEGRYREYVERIKLLRGQYDPFFIGREREINQAVRFLEGADEKIKCVYIHGMTGLGKTKLAQQITAYYATDNGLDKTGMRMVRLQKVTSTSEMGVIILNKLGMGMTLAEYDEDILFETICMRKQKTVLLLDNADDLLCPTSQSADNFKNQLSALLDCTNKWVKFIITSRYPIDFIHLTQKDNFHAVSVQPLDELDSIKLLRKASRSPNAGPSPLEQGSKQTLDDQYAKELAVVCGNCPKMLRAVASRLRNGMKPSRLLETLSLPDRAHVALSLPPEEDEGYFSMGEDQDYERDVLPKMVQMISGLAPELKEILIRLSVFPSAFSDADAASVLDKQEADLIDFHLDDLKNRWGMLEGEIEYYQEDQGPKWYSMHALVRTACLRDCYSDENSKNAFHEALHGFSDQMGDVLDEIAVMASTNAQASFKKLDQNQANIMHYLEVQSGCKLDDSCKPLFPQSLALPYRRSSTRKGPGLTKSHTFLEKFLAIKKRCILFEGLARQAERRGDVEGWGLYMAWAQDQRIDMSGFDVPIKELTPVINRLRALETTLSHDGFLALAQCMYVKGRAFAAMPDPDFPSGLKLLEEAKALQTKYQADPTLLARTINSLGSLYFKKRDVKKSLENHLQAWKMIGQITKGNPEQHFDSPMHIMNIGTCYYCMGNEWMDKDKPKDADRYYQQSIDYYDRALRIQHSLGLQRSVYIARYIRNKALSLFEMKRFDEALKCAVEALNMRKHTFDRHRDNVGLQNDVARSYYQVAMCYHRSGDKQRKEGQTVDTIDDLKEAEKHYHEALKLTFDLGYDRRIHDYDEFKEDYLELTQMIRGAKEKNNLERAFVNFEVRVLDVGQFLEQQAAAGRAIGRLPPLDPDEHGGGSQAKKCRLS